MTNEQLAYEIARGIGQTGVEGHYGSVSCSTAGDYPSMGISQWEGILYFHRIVWTPMCQR